MHLIDATTDRPEMTMIRLPDLISRFPLSGFLAIVAALAPLAVSAVAAEDAPPPTQRPSVPPAYMSEADMQSAFGGKAIDGHYADGVTFSESYAADGRIDYRERGRDMAGRWSVRAGTFCTIYDTSPTGGCYRDAGVGPDA